jgi:hypothetical protein
MLVVFKISKSDYKRTFPNPCVKLETVWQQSGRGDSAFGIFGKPSTEKAAPHPSRMLSRPNLTGRNRRLRFLLCWHGFPLLSQPF